MKSKFLLSLILCFAFVNLKAQISNIKFFQGTAYTNTLENGSGAYIVFDDPSQVAVNIDYSTNSGSTWTNIVSNSAYTNAGGTASFAVWTIPGTLTGSVLVKVTDATNNAFSSSTTVTVTPPPPSSISVTYPNGGEVFTALQDVKITYVGVKIPKNSNSEVLYKIEVSSDGGSNWSVIVDNYKQTNYLWQIPFNYTSGNLKIKVSSAVDPTIFDISDGAFSSTPNPIINSKNKFATNDVHGTVNVMAKDAAGNIYVGGSFDYVDTILANNIAVWNPGTGAWSALGNGLDTTVTALQVNNGELFVGGLFGYNKITNTAIGIKKYNISSKAWTNFANITQETNCGAFNCVAPSIKMIKFDANYMYVGGFFKTIAGQSIVHAAKYSLSGSTWSKVGFFVNGSPSVPNAVQSFLPVGNFVYVHTHDDTLRKFNIATNAEVNKYNKHVTNYTTPTPTDMLLVGDTIYMVYVYGAVGYNFHYLDKLSVSTDQWATRKQIFTGSSSPKLTLWKNNVYCASGAPGSASGTYSNMFGFPSSLSMYVVGAPICMIVTNDDRLIIGGSMESAYNPDGSSNYKRVPLGSIGIVDNNTLPNMSKLSSTTYFGTYSKTNIVIKSGNKIYITSNDADKTYLFNNYGNIRTSNGKLFKGIVEWDTDSLKYNSLGIGLEAKYFGYNPAGSVNKVIDHDSLLIVAGLFDQADSGMVQPGGFTSPVVNVISVKNVAIWNKNRRVWNSLGAGTDGEVKQMVLVGNDVFISGDFHTAGGASSKMAKYNLISKVWTSLIPENGSTIYLMVADGTDIYVNASFANNVLPGGSVPTQGLAKFNTLNNTWTDMSNKAGDYEGYAMAVGGNYLYIYPFASDGFVKFDKTNSTYTTIFSYSGFTGTINTMEVVGNDLFIGGLFTSIAGVAANNFAKFDISAGTFSAARKASVTVASKPGANGEVKSIKAYGNDLFIGGGFTMINNQFSSGIGLLPVNPLLAATVGPINQDLSGEELVVYPNPAANTIYIKDESKDFTEASFVNSLGQHSKSMKLNSSKTIDISDLDSGLYYLTLTSKEGSSGQKIMVVK